MKKKVYWILWSFLVILVVYLFTSFREGFTTLRPLPTNDDVKSILPKLDKSFNLFTTKLPEAKPTPNAKIFLDWAKTNVTLFGKYNEETMRLMLSGIYYDMLNGDITPLTSAISSFSKKPTPSEFIDKIQPVIDKDPRSPLDRKTLVDMFNQGKMMGDMSNPVYLMYEYLYGPTTEKATLIENVKKETAAPVPRLSPMARTNLVSGYEARPYSEFPKCHPKYRSIPGGTIEEKCFS